MGKKKTPSDALTIESLHIPSLDAYLKGELPFIACYARVLAAIVVDDKVATPAELDLLMDFARDATPPALIGTVIFDALSRKVDLADALETLAKSADPLSREQRSAALSAAAPLLALQGSRGQMIKQRLAEAVGLPAGARNPEVRVAWQFIDDVTDQARRLIKGSDFADAIIDFGQAVGNLSIVDDYQAFRRGDLSRDELMGRVSAYEAQVTASMADGDTAASRAKEAGSSAEVIAAMATERVNYVRRQLQQVEARITHLRTALSENIDLDVEDGGNALERGIQDRLATDNWKKQQVWESIGRTQVNQELEKRVERVRDRLNEQLGLLRNDLTLFTDQATLVQDLIYRGIDRARLMALMPSLRIGAHGVNRLDILANLTLGAGAIGAAGTGVATYFLGLGSMVSFFSLPAIGVALPYVGGALAVAGAFKWLVSPEERRKHAEVISKRRDFEDRLRKELEQLQIQFDDELEKIRQGFRAAAFTTLAPVMLESEAAQRIWALRAPLVEKALARSRTALKALGSRLGKDG